MKIPPYYPPDDEGYDPEITDNFNEAQIGFLRYVDINPGCSYRQACKALGYKEAEINQWRRNDPLFNKWVEIFLEMSADLADDLKTHFLMEGVMRNDIRCCIAYLKWKGWE